MTEFLFGLLGAIIGGSFTVCIMAAIIGGRDHSEEYGAPEGAILIPSEAKERAHG